MPRYKLTIEYHGAAFVGWQRQAEGDTVQQSIEQAIRRLDPDAPSIAAAGRTDAGVHALGQVAHCDIAKPFEPFRLMEALNYHLKPAPVAITRVEAVPETFHARFDATERRYLYRIVQRRAPLAIEKGLAWRVVHPLDADAMHEGGQYLVGHHDFTTFRSVHCQSASPVKTVDSLSVSRAGDEIFIAVRARSFLHNQVRSFVGTLERVGAGKWRPRDVAQALKAADRAACGPVAPPWGLYLEKVIY